VCVFVRGRERGGENVKERKGLVNPKSTSNQSSKPCTVLQYPSREQGGNVKERKRPSLVEILCVCVCVCLCVCECVCERERQRGGP